MSDSILTQHKEYIRASFELGDLTSEELNELGVWCMGEGLKMAWAPLKEAFGPLLDALKEGDSTDHS